MYGLRHLLRTLVFMFNDDYASVICMEDCGFFMLGGEFLSCLKMSLLQLFASITYRLFSNILIMIFCHLLF